MKGHTVEHKNRRSGLERRNQITGISPDRREGSERRSVVSETDRMVNFMKKIPVFNGLTNEQYKKLLYICYTKNLPKDLFIFEPGDKPDGMFILLNGQLKILYHKRTLVTNISPITLVGEVGFFTDTPRSTSAVTTEESSIIKINKQELFRIFKGDNALSNRILLNVINELAMKLQKYTEIIQELRTFKDDHII